MLAEMRRAEFFCLENLKMYVEGKCKSRAHCRSDSVRFDKQLSFNQLSVEISTFRKRGISVSFCGIPQNPWYSVDLRFL